MRTKLAIIAVSGFVVSAVCLTGALALGGGEGIGDAIFNFDGFDLPRCDLSGEKTAAADSRAIAWDGSDTVSVALAANTHYRAGSGDQLIVRGDPRLVSHVRVKNGVVGLDCHSTGFRFGDEGRLDITLPGNRTFSKFRVLGTGNMDLAGLSQPEVKLSVLGAGTIDVEGKLRKMNVNVTGSGTVIAKGETDALDVDVSGSGKIRAGDLAARTADVDVSGSGNIEVAAADEVNVDVSGSGTIYLKKEPRSLHTDISGSGTIVHPDGERQGRSRNRHARADEESIRSAVLQALAESEDRADARPVDNDMQRAAENLRARIRAKVAKEIAEADFDSGDWRQRNGNLARDMRMLHDDMAKLNRTVPSPPGAMEP